jgi:hypothetical protein
VASQQTFSMAQLVALWIKAGGSLSSAPSAVAHAWAESSGRAGVTSPNPDGGTNVGLWQLDTPGGVGAGHTVAQLQDPLTNAQITVKATNDGRDWGEWADNWPADMARAQAAVAGFSSQAQGHPGGPLGLADDILHGLAGIGHDITGAAGAVGGALGGLVQLPSQVTGFLSAAEQFTHAAMWIINPTNWARIAAGAIAAVLLILGIGALTRAA